MLHFRGKIMLKDMYGYPPSKSKILLKDIHDDAPFLKQNGVEAFIPQCSTSEAKSS